MAHKAITNPGARQPTDIWIVSIKGVRQHHGLKSMANKVYYLADTLQEAKITKDNCWAVWSKLEHQDDDSTRDKCEEQVEKAEFASNAIANKIHRESCRDISTVFGGGEGSINRESCRDVSTVFGENKQDSRSLREDKTDMLAPAHNRDILGNTKTQEIFCALTQIDTTSTRTHSSIIQKKKVHHLRNGIHHIPCINVYAT